MKIFSLAILCLMACMGISIAPVHAQQQPAITAAQSGLRVERLSISTPRGVRTFRVEMADTERTREIGMMWRTSVPRNTGMLFNFKQPQQVYFWMENTLSSLDLIFIRRDGTIANIAPNATPLSRTAIPSDGEILGVLEIGAGEAGRLGIVAGQHVRHRMFVRR
jgi:uncharacterized membrane protein (UPF0127 family)